MKMIIADISMPIALTKSQPNCSIIRVLIFLYTPVVAIVGIGMLFWQFQPASLADIEVAPPVTVDSTVLDLSGRDGAQVASNRATIHSLCELMADWTLFLTAGNPHTICTMSCTASLASACVIVTIAFHTNRPAQWKDQYMPLWASITRLKCIFLPHLPIQVCTVSAVQLKLTFRGELRLAFFVFRRAEEANFPQGKILRLEGLVAVRTYMVVIEFLGTSLTELLPTGSPTSEQLIIDLEAKPTNTILQLLPILYKLHELDKNKQQQDPVQSIQIQLMRRRSYQMEGISAPKYKYSFNDKTYDLNVGSSFDSRIGAYRAKENTVLVEEKVKSSNNFTLQKLLGKGKEEKTQSKSVKHDLKLPGIKRKEPQDNPQNKAVSSLMLTNNNYYLSRTAKSFQAKENSYLMALMRQHFLQTVQALRVGKGIKPSAPRQIKLVKKNPKLKTVYLDLDQTLIHCDEMSSNYTVKLDFPVQGGATISAGIRIRPHCNDFLRELSSLAEIIIFTASSASYADVVLDHLDPNRKFFSHRLYRQHCTLQKGFYTKDLRSVNRRLEDSVLVDNSGFSFMMQPQNGIPILPYYHFNKDRELLSLLQFLKEVLKCQDVREKLKTYFFWQKYLGNDGEPKKIFLENYRKEDR